MYQAAPKKLGLLKKELNSSAGIILYGWLFTGWSSTDNKGWTCPCVLQRREECMQTKARCFFFMRYLQKVAGCLSWLSFF